MVRTTLKSRLIVLMVMSSVFLVSAFTVIQLNNQLKRAAEFNIYRAKLGALVTKDRLRDLFPTVGANEAASEAGKIFSSLAEPNVIENAFLLNKEGSIIASEGISSPEPAYDKIVLEKILQVKDKSRWLFPFIDKKRRLINLFLIIQNPYGYTVKLTFSLGNLREAFKEVYIPVIFTVIIVVAGNIILAALLSKTLISPVKLLNEATKDIAGGNLDKKVLIQTQDELEELSDTFNYMTAELKKMKAKAENANPLTKLPGNIVIQEEVEKRMAENSKFALIYCDLDNFKAFNDKYGVHAGDEAIMITADIFKEALSRKGKEEDFIGHEGGDDFLLLTVPERAEEIGNYVIGEFDKRIKSLYSKEDLEQGYIMSKSRETGDTIKFPIMTISLAGVTNVEKKIDSYAQLTNIAAELKKAAKRTKSIGSKLLIDRRKTDLGIESRIGDENARGA
ncbi:MAG: diguanylate cyclase [Candidatus Omnitrophica bacterium]|nr:diguanylate cyclase [Candidatus Omnitrophota bacterium]